MNSVNSPIASHSSVIPSPDNNCLQFVICVWIGETDSSRLLTYPTGSSVSSPRPMESSVTFPSFYNPVGECDIHAHKPMEPCFFAFILSCTPQSKMGRTDFLVSRPSLFVIGQLLAVAVQDLTSPSSIGTIHNNDAQRHEHR